MKKLGTVVTLIGITLLTLLFAFCTVSATNGNLGLVAIAAALAGIGIVLGGIALMVKS